MIKASLGSWEEEADNVCLALVRGDAVTGKYFCASKFEVTDLEAGRVVFIGHDSWTVGKAWHTFESGEYLSGKYLPKDINYPIIAPTDSELVEEECKDTLAYYKPMLDIWLSRLRAENKPKPPSTRKNRYMG